MFLDDVDYLVWDLYYTLPIKANHAHLPCMQAYSLCSFYPMNLLHKHLHTYIVQDRKPRVRLSYPRRPRSSSRCSRKKWLKQTRRKLRNLQSAPITVQAPSREASPRAFLPPLLGLGSCWTHALHLDGRITYISTAKLGDYSGRVDCP
jgi:hypothetical protein